MFLLINVEVGLTSVVVFVFLSQVFLIDIKNFEDIVFLVDIGGDMTIDFD